MARVVVTIPCADGLTFEQVATLLREASQNIACGRYTVEVSDVHVGDAAGLGAVAWHIDDPFADWRSVGTSTEDGAQCPG